MSGAAEEIAALIAAARGARARAYAPYSSFRVGAALQLSDGSLVAGANVENASYGHTICAERAAICAAVAAVGLLPGGLLAVAVVADTAAGSVCAPCGACRQVLWEFGGPAVCVTMVNERDGGQQTWRLEALLPLAFGPTSLPSVSGPSTA